MGLSNPVAFVKNYVRIHIKFYNNPCPLPNAKTSKSSVKFRIWKFCSLAVTFMSFPQAITSSYYLSLNIKIQSTVTLLIPNIFQTDCHTLALSL